MQREHHRWYARDLGRDMDLIRHGHAGWPMLVFPTSMGSVFEYEDRGMVHALADKIDAGQLQLMLLTTLDGETFYARDRAPRGRIDRYLAYERYLLGDVVSFVKAVAGGPTMGLTGCSFGAYHAFTMALRHPDVFTSCITMGGAFDITRFLDGYSDLDTYLLNPTQFLPRLSDDWFLSRLRQNKWVLVTGEHDICRRDTEHAASMLASQHVPHALHVWSHGSYHDWPEWIKMARAYVP
jgi:esterase/lipase superfamily enzyme